MNAALNTLTSLGIMILTGMLMGRLMKRLGFPNVTGYLLAGILLGPYLFPMFGLPVSILSENFISGISVITEVALAFIAYSAGGQLRISDLKQLGSSAIVISVLEAVAADIFVSLGLILSGTDPEVAFLLGAIASATAPAATILVVRQFHARGPVTRTLLAVAALDDAWALILFSVTSAIIESAAMGNGGVLTAIFAPAGELLTAVLAGTAAGILMLLLMRVFHRNSNRIAIACGVLFLLTGISDLLDLNAIMACMTLGFFAANVSREADSVIESPEPVAAPVYILFFVASGAGLQFSLLRTVGVTGLIYILLRFSGKIIGTMAGTGLSHTSKKVGLYLGPCLLPQAGIAIGLTQAAGSLVPEYASAIRAVVLTGTLICELIGPGITRLSLTKAGEIKKQTSNVRTGEQHDS